MILQFPNIRLHLFNRLMDNGRGCVAVMFQSAYDLGLIPSGSLDGIEQASGCNKCGSMWAARHIIEIFFQCRSVRESQLLIEQICACLDKEVEQYKAQTNLDHTRVPGVEPHATECSRMAPVVFDFLLQLLRPYT